MKMNDTTTVPAPINHPPKRLLTVKETVREIGGTPWMWRSLVWDRKLPAVRIGRLLFLDRQVVEDFISRQTVTA